MEQSGHCVPHSSLSAWYLDSEYIPKAVGKNLSTNSPHSGRSFFPPVFFSILLIGNLLAAKPRSEPRQDNR